MTTLTRELNNPHSPLYQWFEFKQSDCGDRLIEAHNSQMSRCQIIRPSEHIKDFALLGTSFVYAFRWYLGLLDRSFNQTVASYNLNSTIAEQLLKATTYVRVTHKPDLTKIRALLKADAQGAIGWASFSEQQEYSVTIR